MINSYLTNLIVALLFRVFCPWFYCLEGLELQAQRMFLCSPGFEWRLISMMLSDMNSQISSLLCFIVAVWTLMTRFLATTFHTFVTAECWFPAITFSTMTTFKLTTSTLFIVRVVQWTVGDIELFHSNRLPCTVSVVTFDWIAEVNLYIFRQFYVIDSVFQVVNHFISEIITLIACICGWDFVFCCAAMRYSSWYCLNDKWVIRGWNDDRFAFGGFHCCHANVFDFFAISQNLSRSDRWDLLYLNCRCLLRLRWDDDWVLVTWVFDTWVISLDDFLFADKRDRGGSLVWHFLNDGNSWRTHDFALVSFWLWSLWHRKKF